MTAIDGSIKLVRRDNQGNVIGPITGPIEGRYLRNSATDPRRLLHFFAGGQIRQPSFANVYIGDDTGTSIEEPGMLRWMVADPQESINRIVLQEHTSVFRRPNSTVTQGGASAPGDIRQNYRPPFGYPGVINEGGHMLMAFNPDTAGDTIESEECYIGLGCTLIDRQGHTLKSILGVLDGVKNDNSTLGIPTFGQRGVTETADDFVTGAGYSSFWDYQVPIGFKLIPGWGGPSKPVMFEPGDQLAIQLNPDANPTGNTVESEDPHFFEVPMTYFPTTPGGKPKTVMLRQSNTQAQDDFNFYGTSDVYVQGGEYRTIAYHQIPNNVRAMLGWPQGAPMRLLIDKA